MKSVYNVLGQLFGFLTIVLYAFLFANAIFSFDVDANLLGILATIKTYAIFVVCGLAGLEFVSGKKLLGLIYFVLLAFVVVFSFFPEVRDQITQVIQ
jgi:hypothetical protein